MDAGACFCPERFQLDGRLIYSLHYLEAKKLFLIKSLLVFEHEIDGTTQLVGEDRQGLCFTMFTGEPFEIPFAVFVAFEEEDSCFGEGPSPIKLRTSLRWELPIFLPLDPYFFPFDSLMLFIRRQ